MTLLCVYFNKENPSEKKLSIDFTRYSLKSITTIL